MAYINTAKNIEFAKKVRNIRYDMGFKNIIEIIDENENDPFGLVSNGFNFGFAQGYKQAQAEIRKTK